MSAPGPCSLSPGARADGESLLRSRKRNFSEAEVSALLRGVSARRKKLLATPQDKVPLWQRTQLWKQVTEAVNSASSFRNRRTLGEVKKKWSDIKIEAKKRLRVATERGDDAELRPTDKRILAILDRDCPIKLEPDCPPEDTEDPRGPWGRTEGSWGDSEGPWGDSGGPWGRRPRGVKQEPGLTPTIVHVTTVKSEPLLSDSDPSSTSTSMSTEHAQNGALTEHAQNSALTEHAQNSALTERAQSSALTERAQSSALTDRLHQVNHVTERAQTEPLLEHAQNSFFTDCSQTNHVTERAQTDPFPQRAQTDPFPQRAQTDPFPQRAQTDPFPQRAQTDPFPQRAQTDPFPQRAQTDPFTQSTRPDVMLMLLQNQQQILDTLRNMAQTFSQINSSLQDISHSLRNR